MKVQLRVADSSLETGALIKEYLEARGIQVSPSASSVIAYGKPITGAFGNTRPSGRPPGFGKIYNMKQMNACAVRTVPWFQGTSIPAGIKFPLLARSEHGYGGTDIVPVFQPEEVAWRVKSGWDWFSQFVPIEQEYRIWVFRDEVLDLYKKVMNRPSDFKFIGRNFRNGFDFKCVSMESDVAKVGLAAVKALYLDWAAIDLVRGKDGLLYVLECNTAPGAIKSESQATLSKLVDRMAAWVKTGCPERGY